MAQSKYSKAYEAYQQAVYRDGRNPTFWCSIGVLYYQINQYRDALDAYSRAIRLNPYISEVWYDLGTLVSLFLVPLPIIIGANSLPSMNHVTIRPQTHSMPTKGLRTSILPTFTLKLGWISFVVTPKVSPTRIAPLSRKTYTLSTTKHLALELLQACNGVPLLLPYRPLLRVVPTKNGTVD